MDDIPLTEVLMNGSNIAHKFYRSSAVYVQPGVILCDLEITLNIEKKPINNNFKCIIASHSNGYFVHSFNISLIDTDVFKIVHDHILYGFVNKCHAGSVADRDVPNIDYYIDFVCRNIRNEVWCKRRGMYKEALHIYKNYAEHRSLIEYSVSRGDKFYPTFYRQFNIPFNQEIFDGLINDKLWKYVCQYAVCFDVRHPVVDQYIHEYPDLLIRYCRKHRINLIDVDSYVPPIHGASDRNKFIGMYKKMVEGLKL